jgi:hypothetical protein
MNSPACLPLASPERYAATLSYHIEAHLRAFLRAPPAPHQLWRRKTLSATAYAAFAAAGRRLHLDRAAWAHPDGARFGHVTAVESRRALFVEELKVRAGGGQESHVDPIGMASRRAAVVELPDWPRSSGAAAVGCGGRTAVDLGGAAAVCRNALRALPRRR